jgi:hypothetical protein
VRASLAGTGFGACRQPRPVERPDLALVVERQHHGMGGRIDTKPDHVLDLGREVGIGRELERPDLMRAQAVRRRIRCTEPTLSPLAAAIGGAVQWVTWEDAAEDPRHIA